VIGKQESTYLYQRNSKDIVAIEIPRSASGFQKKPPFPLFLCVSKVLFFSAKI
jgi:hypothetical protein